MPTELNRIKELAGLQQEAAVSLKGKESALKAWYNKYSKYTGGNGDPLPFGLIKAYTESGIISDGYEENELAKAEKALGKKEGDWEDQDWQKVYSMSPITQGMERDLLTATGSKTVDEELLAKVYDVIEDMYPSYDQVLGKKESAVAEAPASAEDAVDVAMKGMKPTKFIQIEAEIIGTIQDMMHQGGSYERVIDKIEDFITNEIGQQYVDKGIDIVKKAIQNKDEEMTFDDMINQIKSTGEAINSSVDDTIQRARAQIETLESALKEDYKKFQGMKPYKPKKK